ncbi:TetR/AcrR family transcriptional regulator [Lysinibacillus piscis]|uniref:TetR/AcrR family transcriptional regulator n=1 Tax=Lysinibacillus piscis TaxID=2518931 RepID=UPI00222EACA4|nr:TetR/AcrR family transcriptional regulator [Lysinibacillus sp. KH24]
MKPSSRALGRPRYDENAQPMKQRILETSIKFFIKNGYKNISMDELAIFCDVTKATIYYYYPTKGDLYTCSLVVMMNRIQMAIRTILEQPAIPLKGRLEQLAEVHLSATMDIDMKNFMREAAMNLSDSQLEEVYAAERAMYQAIEDVLQMEMTKGVIEDGDAAFLTHAFMGLLAVGYVKDNDGKSLFQTPAMAAKEIVRFFWQSVGMA